MAQRKQQKAVKPPTGSTPAASTKAAQAGGRGAREATPTDRDQLVTELKVAKARIAELEQQREDLLNRIDWVIDSLNSLLDSDA
jgi:hypothetical protein